MTKTEFYFLKLMEECNEVSQRVSKLLQFGPYETQNTPSGTATKNNMGRLRDEINDMLTIIDILEEKDLLIKEPAIYAYMEAKRIKVNKYLKYSQSLGCIEGGGGADFEVSSGWNQ